MSTSLQRTTLANGLTLISENVPGFQSVSLGIWVKKGSRHEAPSEIGVCHFLEHMLFKGTEKRSAFEIARLVDSVGGDFNAFTAREYTCFHLMLLKKDLELGIELLCDLLLHSTFEPKEFLREKKVILQEIDMVEESPEELIHDLFFEKAFPKSGLGQSILGSKKQIQKMTRAQMIRFFKREYRADQLILAFAGDLNHSVILKACAPLQALKGQLSVPEAKEKKTYEFSEVKPGLIWEKRPTEQTHLLWGVGGPHYYSNYRFVSSLVNLYLGGGMSSALFQVIREQYGLAYTIYSSLNLFQDEGAFLIYAGTSPGKAKKALTLINQCVQKITKKKIAEKDLRFLKNHLIGTLLICSDSVENRMSNLAKNEIYFSGQQWIDEICQKIDRITTDEFLEACQMFFGRSGPLVLAMGPKNPF